MIVECCNTSWNINEQNDSNKLTTPVMTPSNDNESTTDNEIIRFALVLHRLRRHRLLTHVSKSFYSRRFALHRYCIYAYNSDGGWNFLFFFCFASFARHLTMEGERSGESTVSRTAVATTRKFMKMGDEVTAPRKEGGEKVTSL